ncbi:MAG TPA: hemerythrin domain-containing protein [Bradyrhizobium sp.]
MSAHMSLNIERRSDLPNNCSKNCNRLEIRKLLTEIGGKLKFHLSMEDSYVYPKALAAANSDLKAVAKKMQAEMVGISDAFGKYLTTWTKISILKDPAKFISDTKSILATLKRRIDLEEHDFYPLLHAHL